MQLKSLRCPNCNGSVRQIGDKRYVCESCGTSFIPDLDPEDVEAERIKAEAEVKKAKIQATEGIADDVKRRAMNMQAKRNALFIVVAVITVIAFVIISNAIRLFNDIALSMRRENDAQGAWELEQQARYAQSVEASIEAAAERSKAEEEARKAEIASYRLDVSELTADAFFAENAKAALRGALDYRDSLIWTDWQWVGEPEYVTSFFLTADSENVRHRNILISIYKVTWQKGEDEDAKKYEVYDATALMDLSRKSDGSIASDYSPDDVSGHSELPVNQFLRGYYDKEQLIREVIYAESDYLWKEFDFSDQE